MKIDTNFVMVTMALLLFGIAFNAFTAWMERANKMQGFTAMMVVGGVFGTLVGAAFVIGLLPAMTVGLLFIASGVPMIAGSWARHTQTRDVDGAVLREIVSLIMDQEETLPAEHIKERIMEIIGAES